ncbi:MAG: hypothetical protein R3E66_14160 [bacterium]
MRILIACALTLWANLVSATELSPVVVPGDSISGATVERVVARGINEQFHVLVKGHTTDGQPFAALATNEGGVLWSVKAEDTLNGHIVADINVESLLYNDEFLVHVVDSNGARVLMRRNGTQQVETIVDCALQGALSAYCDAAVPDVTHDPSGTVLIQNKPDAWLWVDGEFSQVERPSAPETLRVDGFDEEIAQTTCAPLRFTLDGAGRVFFVVTTTGLQPWVLRRLGPRQYSRVPARIESLGGCLDEVISADDSSVSYQVQGRFYVSNPGSSPPYVNVPTTPSWPIRSNGTSARLYSGQTFVDVAQIQTIDVAWGGSMLAVVDAGPRSAKAATAYDERTLVTEGERVDVRGKEWTVARLQLTATGSGFASGSVTTTQAGVLVFADADSEQATGVFFFSPAFDYVVDTAALPNVNPTQCGTGQSFFDGRPQCSAQDFEQILAGQPARILWLARSSGPISTSRSLALVGLPNRSTVGDLVLENGDFHVSDMGTQNLDVRDGTLTGYNIEAQDVALGAGVIADLTRVSGKSLAAETGSVVNMQGALIRNTTWIAGRATIDDGQLGADHDALIVDGVDADVTLRRTIVRSGGGTAIRLRAGKLLTEESQAYAGHIGVESLVPLDVDGLLIRDVYGYRGCTETRRSGGEFIQQQVACSRTSVFLHDGGSIADQEFTGRVILGGQATLERVVLKARYGPSLLVTPNADVTLRDVDVRAFDRVGISSLGDITVQGEVTVRDADCAGIDTSGALDVEGKLSVVDVGTRRRPPNYRVTCARRASVHFAGAQSRDLSNTQILRGNVPGIVTEGALTMSDVIVAGNTDGIVSNNSDATLLAHNIRVLGNDGAGIVMPGGVRSTGIFRVEKNAGAGVVSQNGDVILGAADTPENVSVRRNAFARICATEALDGCRRAGIFSPNGRVELNNAQVLANVGEGILAKEVALVSSTVCDNSGAEIHASTVDQDNESVVCGPAPPAIGSDDDGCSSTRADASLWALLVGMMFGFRRRFWV